MAPRSITAPLKAKVVSVVPGSAGVVAHGVSANGLDWAMACDQSQPYPALFMVAGGVSMRVDLHVLVEALLATAVADEG